MDAYATEMRENYRHMATEEIIDRLRTGTLTEVAKTIALDELSTRGITDLNLEAMPQLTGDNEGQSFIRDCWRGKQKLWRAYWSAALLVIAVNIVANALPARFLQTAFFLVVYLPLQVFWSVSIWRCSPNCSHWFWEYLACFMVGLGVLVTIGGLFSLRA